MRRFSKQAQATAEKYLVSMGTSADQLTDEQLKIVVNFTKARRVTTPMVVAFVVLGLALGWLGFVYNGWAERKIEKATPARTIFLSEADNDAVMSIEPYEIKTYLESLASLSFNTGPAFMLAVVLLSLAVIIPLYRRSTANLLEAFISAGQGAQNSADSGPSD